MGEKGFSSPADLLEYLKTEYYQSGEDILPRMEPGGGDVASFDSESVLDELCFGRYRVNSLIDEVVPVLSTEMKERLFQEVAFGVVSTKDFNATCVKSADNKYAVLVNKGLLMFLSKTGKIDMVINTLKLVENCSEKKDGKVTYQDLCSYQSRLVRSYRQFGLPQGPIMSIDESLQITYEKVLFIWQLFVLCHELAHYLNHDFDKILVDPQKVPWLLAGERNYNREFEADKKAFYLVTETIKRKYGYNTDQRFILIVLARLFKHISLISDDKASVYHPSGIERISRLRENYFKSQDAEVLLEKGERDFCHCLSLIG
ncbi:MAG: hypothetical protein PHY90_02180 [Desulfitobacteriaceae bacterium]|nr:hypothetical protein [Desulfitobacteriaceae bacterium]